MRDTRVVANAKGDPYNLRAERRLSALEARAAGVARVDVAAASTDWEGIVYDAAITATSTVILCPHVGASDLKVMAQTFRLGTGYFEWNAWAVAAAVGGEALAIHWWVV